MNSGAGILSLASRSLRSSAWAVSETPRLVSHWERAARWLTLTRMSVGLRPRARSMETLWAFCAEEGPGHEPLGGLGEGVGLGCVHAGEGGGELGAQGVGFFAALAREGEELGDDALAGLDGVEVEVLEDRAVDLVEAVADGGGAPGLEDEAAARGVEGVEVAGAFGGLEGVEG